jgi:uncharacterized protein (TIGR02145 family)
MKISKYIDIPLKSLIIFVVLIYSSCDSSTEPKTIHGCIDSQACNYNPSATLDNNSCEYLDNCDVCDNDPSNDCGQDCNDEWGGTATLDDCGFCSGGSTGFEPNSDELGCGCFNPGPLTYCFDGDDDSQGSIGSDVEYCLQDLPDGWVIDCTDENDACMSNTYDCWGDCSGIAFIDDCGECVGGNTNQIENYLMDCVGICNGTSHLDDCGICDEDPNNDCLQDCNGEWGGSAFLDVCNICSGGSTGHIANSDQDCFGECFGSAVEDCTGNCNGTAFINACDFCVGGDTGLDENDCEQVVDYDGNIYETVAIGGQVWMAENLNVTHYSNGDAIPNITNNYEWGSLTTGAYGNYSNDPDNSDTYGRLYNWYAVDNASGVCPEGWHVPSETDWTQHENGGKLKTTGTIENSDGQWHSPNTGATNETGFAALPSGYRLSNSGNFGSIGYYGYFWSSTAYNSNNALSRRLNYNNSDVYLTAHNNQTGYSIRCVKDSE